MTDAGEIRILEDWSKRLVEPIPMRFLHTRDPRSEALRAFCSALAASLPTVTLLTERSASDDPPALIVGDLWRLHTVPKGRELEPFLEVLASLSGAQAPLAGPLRSRLQAIPLRPDCTLFVSERCPFCPHAIRQLIPLTLGRPRGRVTLIDAMDFPEMAEALHIKAVPTLILNGVYRLTGEIELSSILEILEKEDPALLNTETLERMLKEGQASVLAGIMLERSEVFESFLPLLIHPEWNVRLGAMVVLEELAESNKELARTVLDTLWGEYPRQAPAVRGDILYLIGEHGDRRWTQPLADTLQTEIDQDIRDLLTEALSKLT